MARTLLESNHDSHNDEASSSCFAILLVGACLLQSGEAAAAPLGSFFANDAGADTEFLAPHKVHARAVASFQDSASQLADDELSSKKRHTGRAAHEIQLSVNRYSREVAQKVRELGGDGALTLGEVEQELTMLRADHLNHLREDLRAVADSATRPPRQKPNEGWMSFSYRQLRYTFLERNRPVEFAWLAGVIAGFVGLSMATSALARRWVNRSEESRFSRRLLERARGPFALAATVIAVWVWLTMIWVPIELAELGRQASLLGLGFAALWYAWSVSEVLPQRALGGERRKHSYDLFRTVMRAASALLFLVFVIEVIVGTDFTTLIAGVGVAGLALTLAAQDGLKNIFGAGTIHADHLFRVGELVRFRDYFGAIEQIGFRSVKMRTLQGHLVTIPNGVLAEDPVENVDARPYIRREMELQLVYQTPPKKVKQAIKIVREVLENSEHVRDDEPYHVAFHSFSEYSLDLAVLYHHRETSWWKAKEHDSEINLSIMEGFAEAEIEFAFPTRTLDLHGSSAVIHAERSADRSEGESESPPDSSRRAKTT